ncbi:D-alanyl-D-alanine carboxypeptidase family protein [Bacillus fonticola]|uniref:D-alanyl-D-alanine carboxypeptidase family protein n=1 Tax=Bacillus fonticola TaxID=2728853 RepID=UPI001474D5C2|nr:D-alanyl-D-alanine carboxypeptidase family protein [Bacillus fonticola]
MNRWRRRFTPLLVLTLITTLFLGQEVSAQTVGVSSEAAILMDQKSGRILFQKNAFEKRKIASITKIMTAILAIESGKLDNKVKPSDNAIGTEGSSLYLTKEDRLTLEDLVYGLMLRSGNDAAVAISETVGGSVEGFVYMMNEKAEQIGMENTNFVNPNGLDAEGHYSTAYDMALLTKYAMENEKFREITGTKAYTAEGKGVWHNKNRLLTELYEYSTGGKTGYTKVSRRTLVSTAQKDGMDLIVVTLQSGKGDWDDHKRLFTYGFDNYDYVIPVKEGKIKEVTDSFYEGRVYNKQNITYPITGEEVKDLRVENRLFEPEEQWLDNPETTPDVVGKTFLYFKNEVVGTSSIYFTPPAEKKGFFTIFRDLFLASLGVGSYD